MAWCLVKRRDNFTFTLPYWKKPTKWTNLKSKWLDKNSA
jgi:hypothetical protein